MLNKKQDYIEYTQGVKDIIEKDEYLSSHKQKVEMLEDSINTQELLVPVIGGFSAGKSSLLNSFLGQNVLSVSITPETAIATEIRYSENERIEAIKDDGNIDNLDINEIKTLQDKAQNYNYIKLYLNNQKLKEIEPLVLVDMPGFNAPIATHNKAILKYMPSGVYFIVLLSGSDEKTITLSLLKELNAIYQRKKGFTFCISKTDLISDSDLNEIVSSAKETLEAEFNYDKNVEKINQENGGEVLTRILKNIDSEKLFEDIFKPSLILNKREIDSSIQTALTTLQKDEKDSNNALNALSADIQNLEKAGISGVESNMGMYANFNSNINSYVEYILSRIENDMKAQSSLLTNQALKGGDLERSLNDIIVPILQVEIEKKLVGLQNAITNNINSNIITYDFNAQDIKTWADALNDVTKASAKMSKSIIENEFIKGVVAKNPKAGLYAIIAEFVLEIFSVITEFFATKKKEEVAKEKIENEIIPSIKTQLRPKVEHFFIEQGKVLYENVINAYKNQLAQKQKEIEKMQSIKAQNINNIDVKILALQASKGDLEKLAEKIQLESIAYNE